MPVISFITISKTPDNVTRLSNNLSEIFRDDHEFIVADGTSKDIFQGFNWGAQQASTNILAFIHDDVQLLCNKEVFEKPMSLLRKPMTGIIGAAGTTKLPSDGCWWKSNNEECRGLVFHPSTDEFGMQANVWPHTCGRFSRVVIIDGVFMMMSKSTYRKIDGFDESNYKGFHFYDVDTSLRATLSGLQNYVAPIPLLHKSPGVPNENWEKNRKIFLSKFKNKLPFEV